MTPPLCRDIDPEDAARLVRSFEEGSLDVESFHHRQHLTVAAWLLETSPYEVALARMRHGLHALLARSGKDAYHETVTVFWMRALAHRLAACGASTSAGARLGEIVAWAETTQPLRAHYSPARLALPEAKRQFLEPDLEPLPHDGR
jgi:hypothetical protein